MERFSVRFVPRDRVFVSSEGERRVWFVFVRETVGDGEEREEEEEE